MRYVVNIIFPRKSILNYRLLTRLFMINPKGKLVSIPDSSIMPTIDCPFPLSLLIYLGTFVLIFPSFLLLERPRFLILRSYAVFTILSPRQGYFVVFTHILRTKVRYLFVKVQRVLPFFIPKQQTLLKIGTIASFGLIPLLVQLCIGGILIKVFLKILPQNPLIIMRSITLRSLRIRLRFRSFRRFFFV